MAVFVPTPSVDDTRTGWRKPAGMATAAPNPPSPPRTSGRRVRSTAARISSTARSPAPTSTPAAAYAARGLATRGHDLLERELARCRVVRDRVRVLPVEAGEAEPVVRQVEGGEHAADGE